jgi:hypothetical protein
MPRTDTPRTRAARPGTRVLAVAGAAAALAGAGAAATAAAASAAPAAAVPAPALAGAATAALAPGHAPRLTPAPAAAHTGTAAAPAPRPAHHNAAARPAVTTTTARHAPARHDGPARHARHDRPARPHQMYDSVTPAAIPGGKAVATYADGPYAASPAALHGRHVTWIDTNGTDPAGATVLDVEPGDATPAAAATWAAHRLHDHPHATAVIYTMRSEWPATQTAITTLPHWQQHHIRWWIADPTGTPHLVPGSDATQWYWGTHYDISTVNPRF